MNTFYKPEVFAASFPELALADEFRTQENMVYFTLEIKGDGYPVYVSGVIEASEKEDCFEYNASSDPQNAVDIDFDYLEVDTQSLALVEDFSEYEVSNGMKFKLTEAQAQKLNEWLKEHAIEQKTNHLKGCLA
ncbi:hypothetical protein [Acinetobacter ursingii]|uniref:Uncharacterized protein n=1 Tax=Acinetobacter ursingii TaxID=108980 RepID=A0AA46NZU1_9GAMM|nr:hypothetical protein [Acinetobacter ursingii]UYF70520.1 hypothetical protein LSO60_09445 [Acinetobacter ursingii]